MKDSYFNILSASVRFPNCAIVMLSACLLACNRPGSEFGEEWNNATLGVRDIYSVLEDVKSIPGPVMSRDISASIQKITHEDWRIENYEQNLKVELKNKKVYFSRTRSLFDSASGPIYVAVAFHCPDSREDAIVFYRYFETPFTVGERSRAHDYTSVRDTMLRNAEFCMVFGNDGSWTLVPCLGTR